jgi:RHS repeat-associated protein
VPTGFSAPQYSISVGLNNQVSGDTYDAAGNLLNDGHNYTYDAENRMTSALSSVNYTYDGDDWRVKKSDGDILWYDPAGNHELADVFDTSGNLKSEYYYLGGMLIATRSYFYYSDHLNTVRVMTDLTGNVQFESDFYPFGGEIVVSGGQNTDTQNKLVGRRRDTDLSTVFDYAHFRMYNSTMGRWLQTDPVSADTSDPQTLNRYSYVSDSPTNFIDPTGGFQNKPASGCGVDEDYCDATDNAFTFSVTVNDQASGPDTSGPTSNGLISYMGFPGLMPPQLGNNGHSGPARKPGQPKPPQKPATPKPPKPIVSPSKCLAWQMVNWQLRGIGLYATAIGVTAEVGVPLLVLNLGSTIAQSAFCSGSGATHF